MGPTKPTDFTKLGWTEWPQVLPRVMGDEVLPLAVGVGDDLMLMLPEEQWPALKLALAKWCGSTHYLHALAVDGSMRHAVDGRPVEPVSENARLAAAVMLLARQIRYARDTEKKADAVAKAETVMAAAKVVADTGRIGTGGRPVLTLKKAS